jgi:hypothetical protein
MHYERGEIVMKKSMVGFKRTKGKVRAAKLVSRAPRVMAIRGIKASVGGYPAGKKISRIPPGYAEIEGDLIVPKELASPVPASKLHAGMIKAKQEIKKFVSEFATDMTEEYAIKEIELEISFNAEGKFLGFGVGGAASIKVHIAPTRELLKS